MGNTMVRKEDRAANLLERMKGELSKVLPGWLTAERMARVVLTEFRKSPKLLECTEASLLKCVMQTAELGLEPGSAMNLAYLIPYKKECTLIVGFRGLLELCRRSGQLKDIHAEIVYENDKFDYELGLNPKLEHKPALKNRGGPVFGYSVAHLIDGGVQFEVMSVENINKIRDKALSKITNKAAAPWTQHWEQMARKTLLRRLCKYLPAAVLPKTVQEVLATEDERVYDTTANLISEGTKRTAEDLKKRLEDTTSERETVPLTKKDKPADEKPAAWTLTQERIDKILVAAEKNGWSLEQIETWLNEQYVTEDKSPMTIEKIESEEAYSEILGHISETVQA